MPEAFIDGPAHLKGVFYRPSLAQVLREEQLTETEKLLEMQMADGRPLDHSAGQFVQFSVFGYGEAPISICSSPTEGPTFHLCIRAVGTVSRAVHELSAGDWVGIRGPYGTGFPIKEMLNQDLILVAGGIGLAPMRSVINYVRDRRERFGRVIIVYGSKSPATQLFRDDLKAWADDPYLELEVIVDQADASWEGRTGVVTLPLRELSLDSPENVVAAVVGPPVMYRFVAAELLRLNVSPTDIHFSLERRFRCGIGKCGHCQLNDLYVCQNGPVFRYATLTSRSEAIEAWTPEEE
jgi:NAD(P)H-flavin reductase